MAKKIMIQGTMSNAGKSLVCAGLCRVFKQDGYKVAPFKAQNMALNSFVTKSGGEMGRAQVVQAEAAGVDPDVRMNPVLLKPTTHVGSQVIVNGVSRGNYSAVDYYKMNQTLIPDILDAFNYLDENYDIIVIEGAGSPVEINLKKDSFVNMGLAKLVDAPVLLVGDIDRGGVFAQLYGTTELFDEEEKKLLKGVVVNKFRGDIEIFRPGVKMLEDLCKVPVVGVVPYTQVDIDDEDSLSSRLTASDVRKLIDVAVVRLPMISNFSDFSPFERYNNISLRYVDRVQDLKDPDLIILPGTKSTISDMLWLRSSGFEAALVKEASKGTPIIGICGGFQILGRTICDPDHVESEDIERISGLGLLDIETVFEGDKLQKQTTGTFEQIPGLLSGLSGMDYYGYEIHMGRSTVLESLSEVGTDAHEETFIAGAVAGKGNVYGSYIHGFFDAPGVADTVLKAVCERKGVDFSKLDAFDLTDYKERQYDKLADAIRGSMNMELVYEILGMKKA